VKRYGQLCPLARALDVVGERWSLLVVRELLLGPRRYTDLLAGLPGVPTNLLANRLKDLHAAGVVTQRVLPPPTAVTVYELTEAGRALRAALGELRAWGERYGQAPQERDAVRPAWVLLNASGRPVAMPADRTVELRIGNESFDLGVDDGRLTIRSGPAHLPAATVTMPPEILYRLLAGRLTVSRAERQSTVDGDSTGARHVLDALHGAVTAPLVQPPRLTSR
jgi:DNA-binding HxlR family transcriptional regulator